MDEGFIKTQFRSLNSTDRVRNEALEGIIAEIFTDQSYFKPFTAFH